MTRAQQQAALEAAQERVRRNFAEETNLEKVQQGLRELEMATCKHDWQEQPGEPPVDTCSRCGAVRS